MIGIAQFPTLQTRRCLFRNTAKAIAFVIETSAPQSGMRLAAPTSRGLFFYALGSSDRLESGDLQAS
jgi:hypothetical protein